MYDYPNIGTKIYAELFKALKAECKKYECCEVTCFFYEKEIGGCLLKHCPCDYDITRLEEAVFKAIEKEALEKEGDENEIKCK